MEIKLVCRKENRDKLTAMLHEKGFVVANSAKYVFYEENENKHIAGEKNSELSIINFYDVLYFEALDKETFCITQNGRFIVREKLYSLETQLFSEDFIRVSKSTLVNIKMIDRIIPWIGSKYILVMKNEDRLDVNRTYFKGFKAKLGL